MTADVAQDVYAHPDFASFLAAIRAEPADDTPRLVLADWLEEHGEGERAEFIRASIATERRNRPRQHARGCPRRGYWHAPQARPPGESCPRCRVDVAVERFYGAYYAPVEMLGGRVADLLGFPREWYSLEPNPVTVRVAKGFVHFWEGPAADWIQHADALLARHPVERVTLTSLAGKDVSHLCSLTRRQRPDVWEEIVNGRLNHGVLTLLHALWPDIAFDVAQAGYSAMSAYSDVMNTELLMEAFRRSTPVPG